MIPKYATIGDMKIEEYPTRTYRIDFANKRLVGIVDGIDAMAQAVEKICRTERYSERIYSGDYGIELARLVGASMPFVEANLRLTFEDAFSADSRITGLEDVQIEQSNIDEITASCQVITNLGEVSASLTITG